MRLQTENEQIIRAKERDGYREYRIPGVLPLPDGTLLMTCEARAENRGDWGDIDVLVLRRERNGEIRNTLKIGESSLTPSGEMRTYHNPVLIPDGALVHLIYHRNYERAYLTTSADGGVTWISAREITETFREFPYDWNVCATGPGHGLQMQNGRLVAPIWLANGAIRADGQSRAHWPSVSGAIYSDDHGRTWHAGALAQGMENGNETSAAQLPDGRLLFNFRNMNADRHRALGLSADGVQSLSGLWSPSALRDPMCFGGMAGGEKGAFFVHCDSTERRECLKMQYTTDGGKSWQAVWDVDSRGGYADLAVSGGRAWVFYEIYSYESRMVEALVLKTSSLLAE